MANRIVNRTPFSVSVPKDTTNFFIQTEFKGLCDDKNDVTIDPQSFADMENIYVDDNNILTSRAPFKFYDGESYIIKQWQFGEYTLRYYRSVIDENNNVVTDLRSLTTEQIAALRFLFTIKCVSHKTAPTDEQNDVWSEKSYTATIKDVGWDYIPRLFFVPIEDKIFGWFAGQDFICFNLVGKYIDNTICPYFEDGAKYIYLPIHKQVINGIESEVEAKNFLTGSYRKRYEYSVLSNVNFQKLEGKYVDVRMQGEDTNNQSELLYNVTVQRNQEKMLIYPYIVSGGDYEYDIITTSRATVILRYSKSYGTIEISFDGRIFNPLPKLDNIIVTPFLTKDGFYVIAFTTEGVAQYKLVTTTSDEVSYGISNTSWIINSYFQRGLDFNGRIVKDIDFSFSPTAYFETIDNFVYCVKEATTETDEYTYILYTQWLDSANTIRCYVTELIETYEITSAKVVFKYLAPVDTISDLGPTISLLNHTSNTDKEDSVYTFCCRRSNVHTTGFLYTDRIIDVTWNGGDIADVSDQFIWKMDETGKTPISGEIKSGDLVVFSRCPWEMTESDTWQGGITYQAGDWAIYRGYVYISKHGDNIGNTPPYSAIGVGSDYHWYTQCPVTEALTYRSNGQSYTTQISMKHRALRNLSYGRMRVTKANDSLIFTEDDLQFETFNSVINYSPEELTTLLGPFVPASDDNNGTTWATLYPDGMTIDIAPIQVDNNGRLTIEYAWNNGSAPIRFTYKIVDKPFVIDGVEYQIDQIRVNANDSDIILTPAVINGASVSQSFVVATKVLFNRVAATPSIQSDILFEVDFDHSKIGTENYIPTLTITMLSRESQHFRLSNSNQLLTESYLYDRGVFTDLPTDGILKNVNDSNNLSNRNKIVIKQENSLVAGGYIAALSDNWMSLLDRQLLSGTKVSLSAENTEKGYLLPIDITEVTADTSRGYAHRYYLEKLRVTDGDWEVVSGRIKIGDYIRLRDFAVDPLGEGGVVIPANAVYNDTGKTILAYGMTYPTGALNSSLQPWQIGDDWPSVYTIGDTYSVYPPIKPMVFENGEPREWHAGDPLPIGNVDIYGTVANADPEIVPILLTDVGAWYNINGEIWTSQVNERNRIQIDEYVNVDVDEQHHRYIQLDNYVPDFAAALNETFFAYRMPETGDNLLEITEIRRDTDGLLDDRRSILLYMPKDNEQKTTNPITNLHPLSERDMGVFTGTEVFYVTPTELDDRVMYTALVKSKIPIGCRFGDDIITALDGQVIILPTKRGLAAMAPQDFVATTERTLTYLSDYIQDKYNHFYNDVVMSSALIPNEFDTGITPQIKCTNYRYWLLFHKYLDKEILAFDTRSNTWWRWTTPYPIRQLSVGSRLHVIMQMDYNPVSEMSIHIPPQKPSLMGVDFLYTDEEVDLTYEINEFPELDYTPIANIGYYDDTIDGILNGTALLVPENKFVADRRVLMYADPIIPWHITSQKINFGQINNYKNIKAINISAKGTEPIVVRFTTKSFRDYYHPESSLTNEIKINDLRTFVQRFNLMHLVNFQYKLQNQYVENEESHQLRLNSLSIKYEIKERVR